MSKAAELGTNDFILAAVVFEASSVAVK